MNERASSQNASDDLRVQNRQSVQFKLSSWVSRQRNRAIRSGCRNFRATWLPKERLPLQGLSRLEVAHRACWYTLLPPVCQVTVQPDCASCERVCVSGKMRHRCVIAQITSLRAQKKACPPLPSTLPHPLFFLCNTFDQGSKQNGGTPSC